MSESKQDKFRTAFQNWMAIMEHKQDLAMPLSDKKRDHIRQRLHNASITRNPAHDVYQALYDWFEDVDHYRFEPDIHGTEWAGDNKTWAAVVQALKLLCHQATYYKGIVDRIFGPDVDQYWIDTQIQRLERVMAEAEQRASEVETEK